MSTSSVKKRSSPTVLCKVDLEIMRFIALNRFAHYKDLERKLTSLPTGYNLFRRLRHLRQADLIEPLVGDGGARLGYRLSKRGIEYAKKKLIANDVVLQSRPAFRTQFDHDRIVIEAREILSLSEIVRDFVSETELRSRIVKDWRSVQNEADRDWKVPDAIFRLSTPRGLMTTALEVELTQKAKARYEKIVQALLTSRMFHLVFILCKDEKLIGLIRNEIAEARATNPFVRASNRSNGIYFCTLQILREQKLDAHWAGEDKRFSLNELATEMNKESSGEIKQQVSVR